MVVFKLRAHHLICNLCFQGKGYDERFTQNFITIHRTIKQQAAMMEVVNGCDDICLTCPNKIDNLCRHEPKIKKMDEIYRVNLQLKIGKIISLQQLKTLIKNYLTIENFHSTCKTCSWYQLNLCIPTIEALIKRNVATISTKSRARRY